MCVHTHTWLVRMSVELGSCLHPPTPAHVCAHTHRHTHTRAHARARACIPTHKHQMIAPTREHSHTRKRTDTHAHAHTLMCVRAHTRLCVCAHTHARTSPPHTHVHTHASDGSAPHARAACAWQDQRWRHSTLAAAPRMHMYAAVGAHALIMAPIAMRVQHVHGKIDDAWRHSMLAAAPRGAHGSPQSRPMR
jgi:hypothetical protein